MLSREVCSFSFAVDVAHVQNYFLIQLELTVAFKAKKSYIYVAL